MMTPLTGNVHNKQTYRWKVGECLPMALWVVGDRSDCYWAHSFLMGDGNVLDLDCSDDFTIQWLQ